MGPLAVFLGFATGIALMLVPGPVCFFIVTEAANGRKREALACGLGSTILDGFACFLVMGGTGTAITTAALSTTGRISCAVLAGGLALGLLLLPDRVKPVRRGNHTAFALGALLSATNAGALLAWLTACAIMKASGLPLTGIPDAAFFTLGAAAGYMSWFGLLCVLGEHLSRHGERLSRICRRCAAGLLTIACAAITATLVQGPQ